MTGEFGTAFIERVTVPENSNTKLSQVLTTLRSLRTDTSTYLMALRRVNDQSPAPANNELGSYQYFIGANGLGSYMEHYVNSNWMALTSFVLSDPAAITPGSTFELVQFRLNKEAT